MKQGKYCCPKSDQFGPKCKSCPKNNDGHVCSGHGTCEGAGDKEGSGKCTCENGYKGSNCRECHEDYYFDEKTKDCNKCSDSCKVHVLFLLEIYAIIIKAKSIFLR